MGVGFKTLNLAAWKPIFSKLPSDEEIEFSARSSPSMPGHCHASSQPGRQKTPWEFFPDIWCLTNNPSSPSGLASGLVRGLHKTNVFDPLQGVGEAGEETASPALQSSRPSRPFLFSSALCRAQSQAGPSWSWLGLAGSC